MEYKVELTETLQRIIYVEADLEDNALVQVMQMYRDGEIILLSADFIDFELELLEDDTNVVLSFIW